MKKETLSIKGMHCASCASNIEKNLAKLQGVQSVNVNFASQKAQIVYDEENTDAKLFNTVIKKLGYEMVSGESGQLILELVGVESLHCAAIVEKTLKNLGVSEVNINLATSKAKINYDPSKLNTTQIIESIRKAGYDAKQATSVDLEKEEREKEIKDWKKKFILALIAGIPLLYFSMGVAFGLPSPLPEEYLIYIQLFFSSIIMLISLGFFVRGFKAIKNLSPNMDSLVSIGTGAAYLYHI